MPTPISGARAVLILDNTEVGWATGIQGTETVQVVPIAVLGEVDVQEHEVVGRTCSFTASFVRILDEPLTQATGTTVVNDIGELLNDMTGMTAEVFDSVNNKPIYTFFDVKMTSRAFTVDRGGVMAVNATFVATRVKDESQLIT